MSGWHSRKGAVGVRKIVCQADQDRSQHKAEEQNTEGHRAGASDRDLRTSEICGYLQGERVRSEWLSQMTPGL